MELLRIGTFYQYEIDGFLNSGMDLFFLIQNLQLLIFSRDGLKCVANLDCVLLYFLMLYH